MLTTIPMVLESCRDISLITVGKVVPQLIGEESNKDAVRVGGADNIGGFSGGQKESGGPCGLQRLSGGIFRQGRL